MSLPPWDQETFSFGWEPWEACAIPQCSVLNIRYSTSLVTIPNPPAAPPYTIHVYQGGYAPLTLPVGNIGQAGTYPWTVNLPVNATFMVTMSESKGYTGGTSHRCTVIPGNSRCSLVPPPMSPMSLSFTRTGNSQCGNVDIVVNNGTSPFQVEIIPEYRQQKTLHFATNKFSFVLDLPASVPYFLVVTDADGNSAVEGLLAAGGASDNSCLNAATTMTVGMFSSMFSGSGVVMPSSTLTSVSGTSDAGTSTSVTTTAEATQQGFGHTSTTSKLSIGEIVGVTVTGIVAFTALLAFVWWLLRRRKTGMSSPDEGVKPPEMNLTSSGYNLAYTSQPTYNGPPQTQERTGFTGEPYTPPGAIMTGQSYDFNVGIPPVQHSGITTHAPQARHLVQSASHYNVSSPDQQPLALGNPPQTIATSTPVAGIRNSFESAPSPPWGVDRKQQVASPVLASPSGSHTFPWGVATSPPPRSHTGTALPPYELTPQSQEYRRG